MMHSALDATMQPAWHAELQRVLSGQCFAGATRICDLLSFLVHESLAGRGDRLKEYTIGVEVFGRGEDFDPRVDTNVRTEAWRLRARLERYYTGEGAGNPVQIKLPRRSFVPMLYVPVATPPSTLEPVVPESTAEGAASVSLALEALEGSTSPLAAQLSQAVTNELALELSDHPRLCLFTAPANADAALLMRGEVRAADGQLRALVQLVRREDGRLVWAHGCQYPVTDAVEVPRRVAQEIGRALMTGPFARRTQFNRPVATTSVRPGLVRRILSSGFERGEVDLETVRREARRVECWLLHNPHDQAAHRHLTMLLSWCVCIAPHASAQLAPQLRRCARELLSQAAPQAGALVELGMAAMVGFDWYGALELFDAAVLADPACSDARVVRGLCALHLGQVASALEDLEVACRVDPNSAIAFATLGLVHFLQQRFVQATTCARHALALDARCEPAAVLLADSELCGGATDNGLVVLQRARAWSGYRRPVILGRLGHTYAVTGREHLALDLLRELQRGVGSALCHAAIADIYLGLGDAEGAVSQLVHAVNQRVLPDLLLLRSAPRYDSLRRDARFLALIDQTSVPAAN
jgi:tetratricopeptide (TPR) repeat protein